MPTFTSKHAIGDFIYLRTDVEQLKRQITGVKFRPGNSVIYMVSCGSTNEQECYECEVSNEIDVLIKTQ